MSKSHTLVSKEKCCCKFFKLLVYNMESWWLRKRNSGFQTNIKALTCCKMISSLVGPEYSGDFPPQLHHSTSFTFYCLSLKALGNAWWKKCFMQKVKFPENKIVPMCMHTIQREGEKQGWSCLLREDEVSSVYYLNFCTSLCHQHVGLIKLIRTLIIERKSV